MMTVLQRVLSARVQVQGQTVGAIDQGLLMLLCVEPNDTEDLAQRMLSKVLKLRVFEDERGKMNRSLQDVGGGLLVVSQFTLAADLSTGNRPSFTAAAPPELAQQRFDHFVRLARAQHPLVQTGQFAADMQVHLVNDGPVTIPLRLLA